MKAPLFIYLLFFLATFNILSLSFDILMILFWCVPPWVILPRMLWASWTWLTLPSHVRDVVSYCHFKHFLWPSLSLFSFRDT